MKPFKAFSPKTGLGTPKTRRVQKISKAQFFREISGRFAPELFTPEEALGILAGRLETARRAVESAQRRLLIEESRCCSLPFPRKVPEGSVRLSRPVPVLSALNRSKVFPPIVPTEAKLATLNLKEILQIIEERHQAGELWHALLDLLVSSSGLSWSTGAIFLAKITGRSIDAEDVVTVSQARNFWMRYGEGRARHAASVKTGELPQYSGDWALFDGTDFEVLLPGILLPDHFCRRAYLTNYFADPSVLDVYSLSSLALFQHPFPSRFNPLIFGRPIRHALRDRTDGTPFP